MVEREEVFEHCELVAMAQGWKETLVDWKQGLGHSVACCDEPSFWLYPDGDWVLDWPDYLQDHRYIAAIYASEVDIDSVDTIADDILDQIEELREGVR